MKKRRVATGLLAGCAMLAIILDGKTALSSAQEGIVLCQQTVIPSLFPFFVLSGIVTSSLIGQNLGIFRCLGRFCKIPQGTESLLLIGFLSGYPAGAQLVTQSYNNGALTRTSAQRMLGFCNNAGPAFIFGMLGPMFSAWYIPWTLWGIHIAGALLAALMLSGELSCSQISKNKNTFHNIFRQSIVNIATVCGWVIIFRIIIGFCSRWFLWIMPTTAQVLLSGILELSNGCVSMLQIPNEGLRFILAGFMLSFGGLCVMMQTKSVTSGLGFGSYFPGKAIQLLFTITACCILQRLLFPLEHQFSLHKWTIPVLLIVTITAVITIRKKL